MPAPLRNPALAAMEIATLARLFPGRFVPAAGHGVQAWMDQVGASVSSPMTLLREWVTATRSLLHGQPVTVSGRYVRLQRRHPGLAAVCRPAAAGRRSRAEDAGPGRRARRRTRPGCGNLARRRTPGGRDGGRRSGRTRSSCTCRAGTGPGARERIEAELAAAAQPISQRAVGSPADVARTVSALAQAGATTVVLQPAGDDPDVAATIRLAADVRAVLRSDPRRPGS